MTPPEFFEPYDPRAAGLLKHGREELKLIADRVTVAMAASDFNARELHDLGVADVRVVPPYFPSRTATPPSPSMSTWLRRSKRGIDVLFVSRVVPNKGHVHLLRAFAALRAAVDPNARLFVIGGWGPKSYMEYLFRLRDKFGAEGIVFAGVAADPYLAAFYAEADVLLCLSEHEGFGIPLVEAMRADIPVVAYDAGAVAETLCGAGVLLRTLDPTVVSEVVAKVATEERLRAAILEKQRQRADEIDRAPRRQVLLEALRDTACG